MVGPRGVPLTALIHGGQGLRGGTIERRLSCSRPMPRMDRMLSVEVKGTKADKRLVVRLIVSDKTRRLALISQRGSEDVERGVDVGEGRIVAAAAGQMRKDGEDDSRGNAAISRQSYKSIVLRLWQVGVGLDEGPGRVEVDKVAGVSKHGHQVGEADSKIRGRVIIAERDIGRLFLEVQQGAQRFTRISEPC